jgi:hypothetical protein
VYWYIGTLVHRQDISVPNLPIYQSTDLPVYRPHHTILTQRRCKVKPGCWSSCWFFGISRGQGIGVPNLLGVRRNEPEQVRESDVPSTHSPGEPSC